MATVYTPDYVQSMKSTSSVQLGADIEKIHRITSSKKEEKKWEEHYFQILVFESIDFESIDFESANFLCKLDNLIDNAEAKLVYGTKKDLVRKYELPPSNFPSVGAIVEESFIRKIKEPEPIQSALEASQHATIRFLLQCRQLSQVISHTWLNSENIHKDQIIAIKLITKILNSYNVVPDDYWITGEDIKEINDEQLDKNISEIKNGNDALLIKPKFVSYNSIALALLLCGQAYYKYGNCFRQICNDIFSTYEMVWEYAVDVSWDTFYASRIDIPQAIGKPTPPYTKVTLGYPPRPDNFNLRQGQIKDWVYAKEAHGEGQYPFYPDPKNKREWENQELKFIAPPHAYLPLSTI